jgi:alkylation response protein AidB-like acyl-CoA dehydrogenase
MTDGSAEPSTGEAPTTPFDAFEALDAIAPELETLAREAEELRRPPEAMAKLLRRAKVPWLKVPREVGGLEMTPSTQLDYFARFAYANPTAGWIAFNQSGAAGLAAAAQPGENAGARSNRPRKRRASLSPRPAALEMADDHLFDLFRRHLRAEAL